MKNAPAWIRFAQPYLVLFCLALLGTCLMTAEAAGEAYPLNVNVGLTSGPTPNPAYVNEEVTARFMATVDSPTLNEEAHLVKGPIWSWAIKNVETKVVETDDWAPNSYRPSITGAGATAIVKANFPSAAWWKVTVEATVYYEDDQGNTWTGSGEGAFVAVAGDWVQVTPDVKDPEPMAAGDSGTVNVYVTQPGFIWDSTRFAATKIWHRSPEWVKSYVWGAGAGLNSQPADFAGASTQNAATKWEVKLKWIPVGSPPKRQLFDAVCSWKLDLRVEGDIDNYTPFPPDGHGVTKCHSSIVILAGPGTSIGANPRVTGDVDKSESGSLSWSVTIGLPPISVSNDDGSDEWNVTKPDQGQAPFTIDSGSYNEVSLKAEMTSDALISWNNMAEGPFQAYAQAEVTGMSITKK